MFKKIALLAVVLMTSACTYVDPGHVGIRVNLLGDEKGVDRDVLSSGRYWEGINERIYQFPTFQQTANYDIPMQVEGASATAKIGVRYHLVESEVPKIFETYRKGVDELTNTVIRQAISDAAAKAAASMKADDLISAGKEKALEQMETIVRASFNNSGIIIEKLFWAGNIDLPQTLTASVNAKIEAQQNAMTRNNMIATEEANRQINKIKADSEAYATITKAKAEAEAIKIKGEVLSKHPSVIQLEWINRWDGKQPTTVLGGGTQSPIPTYSMN